jgi:hypothetical protein
MNQGVVSGFLMVRAAGAHSSRMSICSRSIDPFLFSTTLYIVIPSLMVYLTLVIRPRTNRVVNMIVAAGYGLTAIGSAVGEWNYYILGSAIEGSCWRS